MFLVFKGKMKLKIIIQIFSIVILSLFLNVRVLFAQSNHFQIFSRSSEDFNYDHYFQFYELVEDQSQFIQTEIDQRAYQTQDQISIYASKAKPKTTVFHLLRWEDRKENFPLPTVKYNRKVHFGDWKSPDKLSCMDTRGLVLNRDSQEPVEINHNCTVLTGQWHDPYTNQTYNKASDIQIDHVVALKNAYMTGAHDWEPNKRCLYANYLGNDFHLLSVFGRENLKKGDKTPQGYVPPFAGYICQFLINWLKIKFIWNLKITPTEGDAIQSLVQENHCDENDFVMSQKEYSDQMSFIEKNRNLCTP